jgi:hypothetical protein
MSHEKAVSPSAPIVPAEEDDWGEDWGDVTAATPDIDKELELYITDLLVLGNAEDRSTRS